MNIHSRHEPFLPGLLALAVLAAAGSAHGDGFQLNRYQPTPAGEPSFLVPQPWFSSTRYLAAGVSLNYAHAPLSLAVPVASGATSERVAIVSQQLLLHLDVAGSLWDRVTLSGTLPITLLEQGRDGPGVAPLGGAAVGDPRLGVMLRVLGQPRHDPLSISLGADLWIPVGATGQHAGDGSVRFLPKVVLTGLVYRLRWAFLGGFYYRSEAAVGNLPDRSGSSVGSEVHFGVALAYQDPRGFSVGPELLLQTGTEAGRAFRSDYTGLEMLVGGHYLVRGKLLLGLALGTAEYQAPGTPDFRLLFRMAYAPVRTGGPGKRPAEPPGPGPGAGSAPALGERSDRDQDGVADQADLCPDVPTGLNPDSTRPGCPLPDQDGDSVPDAVDACPDEPGAPSISPRRNGCPGKLLIKEGHLVLLEPVGFAAGEDSILRQSYPVLAALTDALLIQTQIRRLAIEVRADERDGSAHGLDLSMRRAESVMRWLVKRGVAADRLEAHGLAPQRPLAASQPAGRQASRRIDFRILDASHGSEKHP